MQIVDVDLTVVGGDGPPVTRFRTGDDIRLSWADQLSPQAATLLVSEIGRYTLDGDIVDTLASELDVLLEGEVLSSRSA